MSEPETTLHRVRRLFPSTRMRIKETSGVIEVKDHGHICWVQAKDIDPLDDADAQMLVTSLLYGLVK